MAPAVLLIWAVSDRVPVASKVRSPPVVVTAELMASVPPVVTCAVPPVRMPTTEPTVPMVRASASR